MSQSVADQKAARVLAPVMIRFSDPSEVEYLKSAVRGLLTKARIDYLETARDAESMNKYDDVSSFAKGLLRQLDRKKVA